MHNSFTGSFLMILCLGDVFAFLEKNPLPYHTANNQYSNLVPLKALSERDDLVAVKKSNKLETFIKDITSQLMVYNVVILVDASDFIDDIRVSISSFSKKSLEDGIQWMVILYERHDNTSDRILKTLNTECVFFVIGNKSNAIIKEVEHF